MEKRHQVISIPIGTIKSGADLVGADLSNIFQFLLVRLKEGKQYARLSHSRISIPIGTIKRRRNRRSV